LFVVRFKVGVIVAQVPNKLVCTEYTISVDYMNIIR